MAFQEATRLSLQVRWDQTAHEYQIAEISICDSPSVKNRYVPLIVSLPVFNKYTTLSYDSSTNLSLNAYRNLLKMCVSVGNEKKSMCIIRVITQSPIQPIGDFGIHFDSLCIIYEQFRGRNFGPFFLDKIGLGLLKLVNKIHFKI